MTVAANSSGVVVGKFTIPSGIPAGAKEATFLGANGSFGRASFFGQGTQIDEVRQIVTQITTTLWQQNVDPLAQTFTMTEATQLEAVDLYFAEVGTTTVAVQIRETLVGYPTRTVIAEARIEAAALTGPVVVLSILRPQQQDFTRAQSCGSWRSSSPQVPVCTGRPYAASACPGSGMRGGWQCPDPRQPHAHSCRRESCIRRACGLPWPGF